MGANYSRKEFILFLYCKLFPGDFSELIGEELKDIEIEKYMFSRKIDAYSRTNKEEIFFEAQLNKSDESHYLQIETIINNLDVKIHSKIVWLAASFEDRYIDRVEGLIKSQNKNIEFIAVTISEETIKELEELNNLSEMELINKIISLNAIRNKFIIVSKYFRHYPPANEIDIKSDVADIQNDISQCIDKGASRQEVMEKILSEMRKQIYYYPSVHRSKRLDTNIIVVGGGKNDVRYEIGINKYNMLSTELRFSHNTKDIFNKIYANREQVEESFDYRIEWDLENFKITCSQYLDNNIDRIIKLQVRVLDKFIRYFSAYINDSNIDTEYEVVGI